MAKVRAPREPVSGHGLYSTRWNGCRIIITFKFKPYAWKAFVLFILKLYKGMLFHK